jgi:uncharacterized protein YkwD
VRYDGRVGRALLLIAALSCQSSESRDLEVRMAELINVEREARGLQPLALSPALSDVARAYSGRMAAEKRVHHELASPVEDRIRGALPDICTIGENISKHTTIDYSLGDLLLSEGHRANLLNDRFTLIGIGIVRGEDGFLYITQEFARPCDPPRKRRR